MRLPVRIFNLEELPIFHTPFTPVQIIWIAGAQASAVKFVPVVAGAALLALESSNDGTKPN